ncbi:hypothetical protein Hanom_Chr04g00356871 [Helianthus anomalus]
MCKLANISDTTIYKKTPKKGHKHRQSLIRNLYTHVNEHKRKHNTILALVYMKLLSGSDRSYYCEEEQLHPFYQLQPPKEIDSLEN